jgi:hypothetical protein
MMDVVYNNPATNFWAKHDTKSGSELLSHFWNQWEDSVMMLASTQET